MAFSTDVQNLSQRAIKMAGFIPPVVVGIGRAVMGTVSKNPVKTARILAVPAKAQLRSQAQKTGRANKVPDAIGPKPKKVNPQVAKTVAWRKGSTAANKVVMGVMYGTGVLPTINSNKSRLKKVKAREMHKELTRPIGTPSTFRKPNT